MDRVEPRMSVTIEDGWDVAVQIVTSKEFLVRFEHIRAWSVIDHYHQNAAMITSKAGQRSVLARRMMALSKKVRAQVVTGLLSASPEYHMRGIHRGMQTALAGWLEDYLRKPALTRREHKVDVLVVAFRDLTRSKFNFYVREGLGLDGAPALEVVTNSPLVVGQNTHVFAYASPDRQRLTADVGVLVRNFVDEMFIPEVRRGLVNNVLSINRALNDREQELLDRAAVAACADAFASMLV
jgi:hypothetical protein